MSSSSIPSTPSRSNRGAAPYAGSALDVSFTSSICMIEEKSKEEQFIKYGNTILVFSVGANNFNVETNIPIGNIIEPIELVLNAHLWNSGACPYRQEEVVNVSGCISPWAFKTRARSIMTDKEEWQTLLTTSTSSIQPLDLLLRDPEILPVQSTGIACSFYGRVCSSDDERLKPSTETPTLNEMGFWVELQYYLNRQDDAGLHDLPKKGTYSFIVWVFLDERTRRRHSWVANDKSKPQIGQYIYCTGRIIGKLNQSAIQAVGNQEGTDPQHSPVLVIIPMESLRPIGSGAKTSSGSIMASPTKTAREQISQRLANSAKLRAQRREEQMKTTQKPPATAIPEESAEYHSDETWQLTESPGKMYKQSHEDRPNNSDDDDEVPDINDILGLHEGTTHDPLRAKDVPGLSSPEERLEAQKRKVPENNTEDGNGSTDASAAQRKSKRQVKK
ncbi:hypothetical protein K445DRAFT_311856 [Daldinia sp. EC12]|nr:hypothetical protein K445DRAFT_311856 [Daldinia sp. EC12]